MANDPSNKRPGLRLHFTNSTFDNSPVGFSLPADSNVEITGDKVRFTRMGRAVEVRDPISPQNQIMIPDELANLIVAALRAEQAKGMSERDAVEAVAEKQPVQDFLKGHGYPIAGLGVAAIQLVASLIGASS